MSYKKKLLDNIEESADNDNIAPGLSIIGGGKRVSMAIENAQNIINTNMNFN